MTRGALIFAFNNEQVNYLAMANWSARNIRRHLGIPVCVVTNELNIPSEYEFEKVVFADTRPPGSRYFNDLTQSVTWYNANRVDAFEASPWDQTLLLDADYVVASNQLACLFDVDQEFLAHRWAYDVTGLQPFTDLNYFGRFDMPMWWATVMLFQKTKAVKMMFDSMNMVRKSWEHYVRLYQTTRTVYRNDHALSIALGIVNGHTLNHAGIPWQLASITPGPGLKQLDTDIYRVDFINPQKQKRWVMLNNQDFHAMGKGHLGDLIANSQ